jgi:hypothetical protein
MILLASVGCRKADFSVAGSSSALGALGTPNPGPGPSPTPLPRVTTENFSSQTAAGKVDILFVDDNSASMETEQTKLGNRFTAFTAAIAGLNWQVGVTTTDCSTGTYGICGDLLPMTGVAGRILTSATPNFDAVFHDTIIRPETAGCVARADCPSGNEEALKATIGAMNKRSGVNAGFFRPGAALRVIILTDEDEQSTGPATATTPQQVVNTFNSIWGATKDLRTYAITTMTGDQGCLAMQQAQQGGIGAYGSFSMNLATLTGGASQSICAGNYDNLLSQIGNDVIGSVTDSVTLTRTPVAGTVNVVFTPTANIRFTVQGRDVVFASGVPGGTNIAVTYEY